MLKYYCNNEYFIIEGYLLWNKSFSKTHKKPKVEMVVKKIYPFLSKQQK